MGRASDGKRPNILFIMTDQQRYDALGANGNLDIHTPNLDRIAAGGVNLHGYYTNHPICGPSRATLFTGRYVHSHRVRGNDKPSYLRSDQELHMFRLIKNAGYSIGYIGKNHLLRDREWRNFDYADVWGYNHPDFWGRLADRLTPSQREYAELEHQCFLDFHSDRGAYAGARFHDFPDEDTKLYAMRESALTFLRQRDPDRPFCLNVQIYEPHAPHIAPRRFREMYPPEEMKLPRTSEADIPGKPRRYEMKYRACRSDRVSDADRRLFMSVYYSMVTYLDEQVGLLLDELDARASSMTPSSCSRPTTGTSAVTTGPSRRTRSCSMTCSMFLSFSRGRPCWRRWRSATRWSRKSTCCRPSWTSSGSRRRSACRESRLPTC